MTIAKQSRRTPNCHPSTHPPISVRTHPSIHGSMEIEHRVVVERDGGRRRPARAVRVRSRVAGVGGCRAARDPSVRPLVRRSVRPSVALSSLPFVAWSALLAWRSAKLCASLSSGNIKTESRAAQRKARRPDYAYLLTYTYIRTKEAHLSNLLPMLTSSSSSSSCSPPSALPRRHPRTRTRNAVQRHKFLHDTTRREGGGWRAGDGAGRDGQEEEEEEVGGGEFLLCVGSQMRRVEVSFHGKEACGIVICGHFLN